MATTFATSKVATTVMPRAGLGVQSVSVTHEITAALVVNDVIQMVKMPIGATILEVILGTDDLDSDGSPAIVLEVGDATTVGRFIAGSTVAQAGGVVRLGVIDGMHYTYTAEDTIDVKVSTAPATGATSGGISLTVIYTMDE